MSKLETYSPLSFNSFSMSHTNALFSSEARRVVSETLRGARRAADNQF